MTPFQYHHHIPLPSESCANYAGMAFDGCHYYFLRGQHIEQFNLTFEKVHCFSVRRPYSCLCFDSSRGCFWAASNQVLGYILCLDRAFSEIDRLSVGDGAVTGIGYNCCCGTLGVSFDDYLCEVTVESGAVETVRQLCGGFISGVDIVCPGYVLSSILDCRQSMVVYNGYSQRVYQFPVPRGYLVKNVVYGGVDREGNLIFNALVTKSGGYSFLVQCGIVPCLLGYDVDPCNAEALGCGSAEESGDDEMSMFLLGAALSQFLG